MAKATKFIATLPDGRIATRSSKSKTYMFCVAVRESYEDALRVARINWPHDAKNFVYYRRELDPSTRMTNHSEGVLAGFAEAVEGCGNVDMYKAKVVAERVADVEKMKAAGNYDRWGAHSWCSRLDLAQKVANQLRGKSFYADVAICPVEIEQ